MKSSARTPDRYGPAPRRTRAPAHPLLLAVLLLAVAYDAAGQRAEGTPHPEALPGRLLLKFTAGSVAAREVPDPITAPLRNRYRIGSIRPWIAPALLRPTGWETALARGNHVSGLGRIVTVEYGADIPPETAAAEFSALPGVEYAEPVYRRTIFYLPNDPGVSSQWYLGQIGAVKGWERLKADSSMLIAVVDVGIDLSHRDLRDAIRFNPGESGFDQLGRDRRSNGIDDDGNGFVDDWRGYDFAGNDGTAGDNDPTGVSWHGTHVAGIAAASGDNGIGIAGVAYGAMILPVKIASDESGDDPSLTEGYPAILYAARMGAKVINCSWGGLGDSRAEQEVIDEVTGMGSLVVAAAGNLGSTFLSYPASYRGVLSVASLDDDGRLSSFSDRNTRVGISAPGDGIYSTLSPTDGVQYGYSDGTSMAAPMVSAAAALVRRLYPDLTPDQTAAVLRATATDISALNRNQRYMYGGGRLDIDKALAVGPTTVAADVASYTVWNGNGDEVIEPGERVGVSATVRNLLAPASKVVMELEQMSGGISLPTLRYDLGPMGAGESKTIPYGTFAFTMPKEVPVDLTLPIALRLYDGDRELGATTFDLLVNPNYGSTTSGAVTATFMGDGRIGFNDFPANSIGKGFTVGFSPTILAEGGLLLGLGPDRMADVVRGSDGINQSRGLQTVSPYRAEYNEKMRAEVGHARFDDAHLPAGRRVGARVELTTYAFNNEREILALYRIENSSEVTLQDLYCSLYMDWDLGPAEEANRTGFDPALRLGYMQNAENATRPMAGVVLLSDQPMNVRALDNRRAPLSNGFTPAEKWDAIRGGISRTVSLDGDCSMLIGAGPITLAPGEDTTIAVAIVAGATLAELRNLAGSAFERFESFGGRPGGPVSLPVGIDLAVAGPNPFMHDALIELRLGEPGEGTLEVWDSLGERVALLADGEQESGTHRFRFSPDSGGGVYFVRYRSGETSLVRKLVRFAP